MTTHATPQRDRVPTGIPGLDTILRGGLPRDRIYLLEGGPGTGKTTFGFQYLLEGARRNESVLYVSLLQTRDELNDVLASHGWTAEGMHMLELPRDVQETDTVEQTIFSPAEVELDEVTDMIVEAIGEHQPRRMVLDSLTELQVLVDSAFQMRRQLMKLKRALLDIPCTAVVTSSEWLVDRHPTTQTIVHGSMRLTRQSPAHGKPRRRVEVEKVRGIDFDGGIHDMTISTGGVDVYPRPHVRDAISTQPEIVTSRNAELDRMFGGGLNCGSTCLVMGTSGAGKSTLTALYAAAAAKAGDSVSVYCFDESRNTYLHRARGLKLGIAEHVDAGGIELREYEIGDLTPGQFVHDLSEDVDQRGVSLVVLDSLSGYLKLMAKDDHLMTVKLHETLRYLAAKGVLTLVTMNLHGLLGDIDPEVDASYLADSVVLMRHFEAAGSVRQCISVLKNRHGEHERSIREIVFESGGLRVGSPLEEFAGVLSGSPQYVGRLSELLTRNGEESGGTSA